MKKLICFWLIAFFIKSNAQDNPCNTKGLPYSSFPQDTTIILPSGTKITFNRCEFFDLRDCLEIIEITDTVDLNAEGLTMYDSRGNALLTCGMISVKLKNCDKSCFDVPIKIKMRIRFQDCSASDTSGIPNLYIGNGGTWQRVEKDKTKLITENNQRYLEFVSKCAVVLNCDVPKRGRKVKFIAPRGKKIEQLRLGTNCPLFYSDEKPVKPKRRVKMRLICVRPEATKVQALMRGPNDSLTTTGPQILSQLKHGTSRVDCKKLSRSWFRNLFNWLKRGEGKYHKKYYL